MKKKWKNPPTYSYKGKHIQKKWIIIDILLLFALYIFIGYMQQSLILAEYHITSPAVSMELDGFKMAHISDFHSGWNSVSASVIIKMTSEQNPDIICLTGDIVDGQNPDFTAVEQLISGLSKITQVYAVSGNNEHYKPSINIQMESIYKTYGVQLMDDKTTTIINNGGVITISGIADIRGTFGDSTLKFNKQVELIKTSSNNEGFCIVLYHRANAFEKITETGYHLVLSGHLHGGIIRLPFFGGILSPVGELMPKYAGGMYNTNDVYLVSNRGIGNNSFLPRIYNPPEVAIVVLHST